MEKLKEDTNNHWVHHHSSSFLLYKHIFLAPPHIVGISDIDSCSGGAGSKTPVSVRQDN